MIHHQNMIMSFVNMETTLKHCDIMLRKGLFAILRIIIDPESFS